MPSCACVCVLARACLSSTRSLSIICWPRLFRRQVCAGTEPRPPQLVSSLIGPILRSKYPAVSAEEQAISVPLQILSLAIFDALLLHIVSTAAPQTWEEARPASARPNLSLPSPH